MDTPNSPLNYGCTTEGGNVVVYEFVGDVAKYRPRPPHVVIRESSTAQLLRWVEIGKLNPNSMAQVRAELARRGIQPLPE
jgi:hypothetical protein